VSPALLQRQTALAGVALLATLGALAFANRAETTLPIEPASGEIRWERAVVGVLGPEAYTHKTSCGVALDSGSVGIAHPVLPCGVDVVVALGNQRIRTEVIARARVSSGRDFKLTKALADELGVHGTRTIRWRFAG
jgi:hypothetical protein